MAVNFPDSPSNGDTHVVGALTYTYTASTDVWDASGVTSAAIQISDTAPSNPSDGELWHNSSDLKLYIYYNDGSSSQWVVASPQQIGPTGAAGQVHMGIASPSAPASGEMWYDTETNDFSLYYQDGTSNQWITVSGPKGDDGADATLSSISESIIPDTDSAYDLGSPTNKFRSLYLSSNTLFLGDSGSISAGPGGEIVLPSIKIGTGANAVKLEADASGKLKTKKIISGVTQAAEEPGNATVVTDMAGLIALTGMSTGQIALVSALNKMFVYTGTGWFLIATVTNSSPTDITGVNATYSLATDGTATTITAVSTDPEGFPLTWSYAVTTGSLGSTATVSQADNVFTITPSTTEADAGTFSITFSVTDGATGAVQTVSAFTLAFRNDSSILFTSDGTISTHYNAGTPTQHDWVVPTDVTSICAVVIGSGAGSTTADYSGWAGSGGGGGALSYVNNIAVTPGETLTVLVGVASGVVSSGRGAGGCISALRRGGTDLCSVTSSQGGRESSAIAAGTSYKSWGGNVNVGTGGDGGDGGWSQNGSDGCGGGGAGGYSGDGGTGQGDTGAGHTIVTASGGAASGGGTHSVTNVSHSLNNGGGVSPYGEGATGAAVAANTNAHGNGGSGGSNGTNAGGGLYGGGGGGKKYQNTSGTYPLGAGGAAGCVRILWGAGRAFPSTNVDLASNYIAETTV